MAERCWKCATPLRWSADIGDFCANPSCGVMDALDGEAEDFAIHVFAAPPVNAGLLPRADAGIEMPLRRLLGATPPRG
jgi:hypothetical protein